jgi:hypothetical protein
MSNFTSADIDFLTPSNNNITKPNRSQASDINQGYATADDLADFLSPPPPGSANSAANKLNPRYIHGILLINATFDSFNSLLIFHRKFLWIQCPQNRVFFDWRKAYRFYGFRAKI